MYVHSYFEVQKLVLALGNQYKVYRFEKDGASTIQNELVYVHPCEPPPEILPLRGIVPDVDTDLILHHFKTGLLWLVAGAGQSKDNIV
jgi:hypothetical protein